MSKKKKPVFTSTTLNNPYELHKYSQLENFTGKPACVMCKYCWYEKIIENKGLSVWNMEIKLMNHECAYCDVAIC